MSTGEINRSRASPAVAAGSSHSGGYPAPGGGISSLTILLRLKAEFPNLFPQNVAQLGRNFNLIALNLQMNYEFLIGNVDTWQNFYFFFLYSSKKKTWKKNFRSLSPAAVADQVPSLEVTTIAC